MSHSHKFSPAALVATLAVAVTAWPAVAAVDNGAPSAQFPFAAPAPTGTKPAATSAPAKAAPAASSVAPSAAIPAPVAATASKGVKPNYNAIYEQNIFDPQRKQWEEKKEVPPPLPPLSSEDVQIYGVMAVGSYKRAIVKLGGKLKSMMPTDPKARPYVTLSEGQSLGGYTLSEIGPQRLIFTVGDTRYAVAINKKEDRPSAPPVPPPAAFQEAVVAAVETPNGANGQPLPGSTPAAAPEVNAVAAAQPVAAPAAPAQPSAAPAQAAADNNSAARPLSLLEAIQQANKGGGSANTTNPFANLK